ncbi:hypothetical protein DPSP01_000131 [Paraphaeosphaeria sporulosa]|uniref:FAD-binding domain-containing protein n=1 Tax=Paraphaeosphaeria sporulosa TaxID=1460663 RepID=A0A177D0I1_9PLEO|nr:uncharacterized protein CC84DRAFT_1171581 [Paraphaeosphaeria sporulosa]OAG12941.1 hypothetical protein CC84DRAFT_1171581 [Paraphaeosphaeria sporulosa]
MAWRQKHSMRSFVIVLQCCEHSELQAEAAGLSIGSHAQKFVNKYLDVERSLKAVSGTRSQILSLPGTVVMEVPLAFEVVTSLWGLVFERLIADSVGGDGSGCAGVYGTGVRVTQLEYEGRGTTVRVACKNNIDETETTIEAALLLTGADGGRSTIRHQLLPFIHSEYAGHPSNFIGSESEELQSSGDSCENSSDENNNDDISKSEVTPLLLEAREINVPYVDLQNLPERVQNDALQRTDVGHLKDKPVPKIPPNACKECDTASKQENPQAA